MKHSDKKKTIISITIITMILGIIITRMYYTHKITADQTSDKASEAIKPSVTPTPSSNKVIHNSSNNEIDKEHTKETIPVSTSENLKSDNEVSEINTNPFTNENIQNENTSVHKHNWVAQYTTVHHDVQHNTVHHDATGHYETQTVSEGYYSEEPVYFTGYYTRCFVCNACLELDFNSAWEAFMCHVEAEKARYGGVWETHQVGTEQVWHDPVTQQVWVEDSPAYDEQVKVSDAYDEQVVSGYTCSSCGAIQ